MSENKPNDEPKLSTTDRVVKCKCSLAFVRPTAGLGCRGVVGGGGDGVGGEPWEATAAGARVLLAVLQRGWRRVLAVHC